MIFFFPLPPKLLQQQKYSATYNLLKRVRFFSKHFYRFLYRAAHHQSLGKKEAIKRTPPDLASPDQGPPCPVFIL